MHPKWEPSVCQAIMNIPLTPNSTVDAGYFMVPNNFVSLNNVNQSVVELYAKVKYQGIRIGEAADGPVHHLDMDGLVYPEVIVVRACVEDHHFKLNSDKFNECYRALG